MQSRIQDVLYLTSASVVSCQLFLFETYAEGDYLMLSPSVQEQDSEFHVYKVLGAETKESLSPNKYYGYYVKEIPLEDFSSETLYHEDLYDQFMLLLTNFINKV